MSTTSEEKARAALAEVVWKNARRMSGTPCFRGTRVPVQNLVDYLQGGHTLDRFLEGFPGVEREQAEKLLDVLTQIADEVPFEKKDGARSRSATRGGQGQPA